MWSITGVQYKVAPVSGSNSGLLEPSGVWPKGLHRRIVSRGCQSLALFAEHELSSARGLTTGA